MITGRGIITGRNQGKTPHDPLTIGSDAEHTLLAQVLSGVDAAATQKGHIKLAGELTGTAALPTITSTHSGSAHHVQGTDTTLGTMAADVTMGTHKLTGLSVPASAGDSIRATTKITEALLESATDLKHTQGTDTALGAVGTKNPPIDADLAIYRNSAASDVLVTSTWTQIKAFLKTYFDGIYAIVGGALGTPSSGTLTNCTGLPAAGIVPGTAASDFLVATTTPFTWIKKTLAEVKTILGLVLTQTAEAVGFTIAGGTTSKTLTVPATITLPDILAAGALPYGSATGVLSSLAAGAANTKLFVNAAGNAPEWASGFYIGTFSRDMTAATGDVSYTGVGFKPSAIIVLATIASYGILLFSVGFATTASNQCLAALYLEAQYMAQSALLAYIRIATADYQYAVVKTFDTDGFTLTWTKGGTPAEIISGTYLALR